LRFSVNKNKENQAGIKQSGICFLVKKQEIAPLPFYFL